ncbi:TfoX/Sxy family protein [Clostridium botulinum]|nr:TfoX/Sxy family protein [Clostridium botulinum]
MNKLSTLPNIGNILEKRLHNVGIDCEEKLKDLGSKEVLVRLKGLDNDVCINTLYALEGAIRGIRWHSLDENIKKDLKDFYNFIK